MLIYTVWARTCVCVRYVDADPTVCVRVCVRVRVCACEGLRPPCLPCTQARLSHRVFLIQVYRQYDFARSRPLPQP